jgi:hypothetical protein
MGRKRYSLIYQYLWIYSYLSKAVQEEEDEIITKKYLHAELGHSFQQNFSIHHHLFLRSPYLPQGPDIQLQGAPCCL